MIQDDELHAPPLTAIDDPVNDSQTVPPVDDVETDLRKRARNMFSLKAAWSELINMVEEHDVLAEQALVPSIRILNQVKQLSQSLIISGKRTLSTNDKFLRPLHLTSKRRLGVIDMYHGGKRGKRILASDDPKKKRGIRSSTGSTANDAPDTQVRILLVIIRLFVVSIT